MNENTAWQGLMHRALDLAAGHRTHPNPRVGAIVVAPDGEVVGEGAHPGVGSRHAEVIALAEAGERARGATLVVTLEPCDHQATTPPCTGAIIDAGITRVVAGVLDPDRHVAGRGVRHLRQAGIEIVTDVLPEAEVEAVDPAYFHHRRTDMPLVTVKAAATLDGQTAAADGTSQWITGEGARRDAHLLRAGADAVMIGAGTLRIDDPRLNVRLEDYDGPQPRPIVVMGDQDLPATARIWERDPVVLAPGPVDVPGMVIEVPDDEGGVDLALGLIRIGELGYLDVLVEGGARLASNLLKAGLVNRGVLYLGAKLAGGVGMGLFRSVFGTLSEATPLEIVDVRLVGPDVRIEWRI